VSLWLLCDLIEHLLALNVVHDDVDLFGQLVEEVLCGLDDILMREIACDLVLFLMRQSPLFIRLSGYLHGERRLLLDVGLLVAFVDGGVRTLSKLLWRLIKHKLRFEARCLLLLSDCS
jgi:hypothetical protein